MLTDQVLLIFALFAFFQVKHYLADFPLQREFMVLAKAKPGWEFAGPLAIHCCVHGGITLAMLLYVAPKLWWLVFVDFGVHFVMDRIKSGPRWLGRFNNSSTAAYWNSFGLDQMVHHFTHYFIVYMIITQ